MHNKYIKVQEERLKDRSLRSPVKLLIIVVISIMVIEMSLMLLFEQLPVMSYLKETILDGVLLSVLVFPILYIFMFRPLNAQVDALESAEDVLKWQRDNLEEIVQGRTDELAESRRRLVEAQQLAHIGSWDHDSSTGLSYWSDETYQILGLINRSVVAAPATFLQYVHPEDKSRFAKWTNLILENNGPFDIECRVVRSDGQMRYIHARAKVEVNDAGRAQRTFGTLQDITDQRAAEERINFLAHYDPLTGLPNRTLMTDRIGTAISFAKRHDKRLAVLALNIDRLKSVNDTFGLPVGDLLIKSFADRLGRHVRGEDSMARLSGDEFLMLLQEIECPENAHHTAQRILEEMQEAFLIADQQIVVTCTIGISIYPEHGVDPDVLITNANAAMYFAKASERGSLRFFTTDMNVMSVERLLMENELRRALKNDELIVHYQPQLDLSTNTLVGFEALVRWNHPDRGMVPPDQFISVAEDAGLIIQIGEQVMRKACFQARLWQEQGFNIVPVAVNVSSVQFRQHGFLTSVETALRDSDLDLAYLELELTESLLLSNADMVFEVLEKLNEMGVKLLIDDFGTGYSSLSYLKRIPVYKLKIDQSFVRGLPNNQDDAAIVKAIIGISASLHMKVIAEGVETKEQLAFLNALGCDEIQGYFYGRPLPADAAAEFLSKNLSI